MVDECNAVGSQKTVKQYKKAFADFKMRTKKKFRKINRGQNATGGGSPIRCSLTNIEDLCVSAFRPVFLGVTQNEPGFPNQRVSHHLI